MKLKIASYNISGGFYEDDKSVDFFDKNSSDNIDIKLLNDTVKIITDENIDIVCFQEIITTERINYINRILEKTPLKFESHFELSPCHVVENTRCGIAILSRFPITKTVEKLFTNPRLSKTTASGNTYYSFDKGLLMSNVDGGEVSLSILTHHNFPFRRFNSTPENNRPVFTEFDNAVKALRPDIITGDFNSEDFIDMMPYTKENYTKTNNDVTTTDGMKYDNILVKNGVTYSSKIIKSLSDHFIVISEIKL